MTTELVTIDGLKANQDDFMYSIIEHKGANLPDNVGEVREVFEFSDWKAKAWKIFADKISRLENQQEAYHSAIRSGQNWGIAALYAQKRMGEITREMPTSQAYSNYPASERPAPGKTETLNDSGVTRHTYQDAERIASHPDVLDSVIEKTKQSEEIPTKTAVLHEISQRKQKERQEAYKEATAAAQEDWDRAKTVAPAQVSQYISKMEKALFTLPAKPPKEGWDEYTMNRAAGYAAIIIKRLSMFLDDDVVGIAEQVIERTGIKEAQ